MSTFRHPSSRELSYSFLFMAAACFIIMVIVGVVWAATHPQTPPLKVIEIGSLTDFPPSDIPYPVRMNITRHMRDVWLVNFEGELHVYASHVPGREQFGCMYDWNMANMRFEDPCHGSKFWLDGTLVDSPASRDLDQFLVFVKDGVIRFDPRELILGDCRIVGEGNTRWYQPYEPYPLCSES